MPLKDIILPPLSKYTLKITFIYNISGNDLETQSTFHYSLKCCYYYLSKNFLKSV